MGKDHELLEAARNGNIAVVEKILYHKSKRSGPLASLRRGPGANVQDSSGYSALHHASLNGHTDVVRILLSHDATPNLPDTRGSSALHLAAWAGHQDICKLLLINTNRPANPNLQTSDNETPLHCAAQHGHTGALSILLQYGANPNITNNRGETPLELAAQYGRLQTVQMLLRSHPEMLLPYKYEMQVIHQHSPLHLASRNGHKNVVEILLAAGVNVNLLTAAGTALHEAALCGKDIVVRTLLNAGADLDAIDSDGRTALDLLEQFPPHVTKGIVSVINDHRNSIAYNDSETDDGVLMNTMYQYGCSYDDNNSRSSPVNSGHWNVQHQTHDQHYHHHLNHPQRQQQHHQQYPDHSSLSSSMGSLGPSSPTIGQNGSGSGGGAGYYVQMTPLNNSKVSPTPPKKPPRRNLSVSPTHLHGSMLMSTSMDSGSDTILTPKHPRAYEYLYLAQSGSSGGGGEDGGSCVSDSNTVDQQTSSFKSNRTISIDQYVQMNPSPTHHYPPLQMLKNLSSNYENTQPRSYNPNRKLRRNLDNSYERFCIGRADQRIVIDNTLEKTTSTKSMMEQTPSSPSHYQQPPTPEHPPPNAVQAENVILERIRPLSQEYKRKSGLIKDVAETGTSPPLCKSLGASSGSLSSSVSLSDDRSASTDCVEEFIGDAPYAGLFKGSTISINNPMGCQQLSIYQKQQKQQQQQNRPERPKTLRTTMAAVRKSISLENHQKISVTLSTYVPPPMVPPSSTILKQNHRHQHQSHSSEDDESNNSSSSGTTTKTKNYFSNLTKAVAPPSTQTTTTMTTNPSTNTTILSPFDEQEEWAKISEIMATFGTGFVTNDSIFVTDNERDLMLKNNRLRLRNSASNNFKSPSSPYNQHGITTARSTIEQPQQNSQNILADWLYEHELEHLEIIFVENGYDDLEFMNGLISEADLIALNISETDRQLFLSAIEKLPISEPLTLQNNNSIGTITVEQWLHNIKLDEYVDIFKKHLYTDMERICRIWEIELQTVLEITKVGHRKRILGMVIDGCKTNVPQSNSFDSVRDKVSSSSLTTNIMDLQNDYNKIVTNDHQSLTTIVQQQQPQTNVHRTNHRKNRPAPKPPNHEPNLHIRGPSELLLGVPTGLQTQWRHEASSLVLGFVRYDVNYLGSTLVKELRGTESTRKSIQKIKRGGCGSGGATITNNCQSTHLSLPPSASSATNQSIICNNIPTTTTNTSSSSSSNSNNTTINIYKRPLCLSISYRGVQFIDIITQGAICEHEIRNIDCACQDADDLSHFAYITKDSDYNQHYCHVFNVESMDLATEIILTLGQAFEVAYQLALKETTLRSPMDTSGNKAVIVTGANNSGGGISVGGINDTSGDGNNSGNESVSKNILTDSQRMQIKKLG